MIVLRARERTPSPHVTEHDDHPLQLPCEHGTGQHGTAQLSLSESAGHAAPPLADCCVMVRVRVRVALPHVALQLDHGDQLETAQSIGQPVA